MACIDGTSAHAAYGYGAAVVSLWLFTLVGPCRAVWDWDLRPAPVCNRVASMIDANKERPLIFLNALNPRLFESVGGKGDFDGGVCDLHSHPHAHLNLTQLATVTSCLSIVPTQCSFVVSEPTHAYPTSPLG